MGSTTDSRIPTLDQFSINHQTEWNKCTDVGTDGAKSMTGKTVGVTANEKTVSKMHTTSQRHALAAPKTPD